MHHFFVDRENIDGDTVRITGTDVNHIKNVLRMHEGDEMLISDGVDTDYHCEVALIAEDYIVARVLSHEYSGSEPGCELYLFQCLPKGDKMEMIIQKAVELGVCEVIPVASKRSVVKLDEKRAQSKIKRWNLISESAAKQSRRVIIPKVREVMNFEESLKYAEKLDLVLMPYENYKDMKSTKEIIDGIEKNTKIGIFIGPEGGFDPSEVEKAADFGVRPISLGSRILRTETAGLAILSVLMFKMED